MIGNKEDKTKGMLGGRGEARTSKFAEEEAKEVRGDDNRNSGELV